MGFTFFVLLLGALIFTLMQKHEANNNRKWLIQEQKATNRETMGYGRDNIYQFKMYCYNMRKLLQEAQNEGIGLGEQRNECFYEKYKDIISQTYCDGRDPQKWCMEKATNALEQNNYINSWVTLGLDDVEVKRMRLPGEPISPGNYKNVWRVYPSEYNMTCSVDSMKQLRDVKLPKDGVSNGEHILRALYIYNHATTFNLTPYENNISFYSSANPSTRFNKSIPFFEKSGITLELGETEVHPDPTLNNK